MKLLSLLFTLILLVGAHHLAGKLAASGAVPQQLAFQTQTSNPNPSSSSTAVLLPVGYGAVAPQIESRRGMPPVARLNP